MLFHITFRCNIKIFAFSLEKNGKNIDILWYYCYYTVEKLIFIQFHRYFRLWTRTYWLISSELIIYWLAIRHLTAYFKNFCIILWLLLYSKTQLKYGQLVGFDSKILDTSTNWNNIHTNCKLFIDFVIFTVQAIK